MAEKKAVKSFLYGALAGAVTGAVTALLFAPKPGRELRNDIADTAQRVGEKTADIGRQAGSNVQTLVKRTSNWATDIRAKLGKRGAIEEETGEQALITSESQEESEAL